MKKFFLKILFILIKSLILTFCSISTEKQLIQKNIYSYYDFFNEDIKKNKIINNIIDSHTNRIFNEIDAYGMAIIVINNKQVISRYYGETSPGNCKKPGPNSLIRIASISKLMTSEILIKLEKDKKLLITDPLQKYSYYGVIIPNNYSKKPIRLYHLASHTSGLPREQPGGKYGRPVFIWPTKNNRWEWLKTFKLHTTPGTEASYSNLAYDLLADAMVKASSKNYSQLFKDYITSPLNMIDTTYTPTKEQCSRLMKGTKPSQCYNTLAAAGSGGVYSTPSDIQKWMQKFFKINKNIKKNTISREQNIYFLRKKLLETKGMDIAGHADGIGLGWVYMKQQKTTPGIYQKTGGAGGFNTYIAMIPQYNIGVFAVITRKDTTKFNKLIIGVNELITYLYKKIYKNLFFLYNEN
ncbi:D-alanyl-D-alanine-carboxypeptidase/endopeptidaseAmpH [Candidatus Providencia siddallii]|uniref:D-alanyl-D-alanine-carboxypeptidase/endopeptidaseAmpH n=1 Tax=Candidatus Providencia siddallii TaxID=1715285 RepID=A0A0M6W867_9GAMM|nr:D-alanyl-D-alanine-carboxypeptidase/endopeptidaseAmpH [Candidatus Providencia siddallii]